MTSLILLNKPYGYLSQFTDSDDRPTLSRLIALKGVYPAGRLDRDSEGLLLLTDDGALAHRLTDPRQKTWKTYWVQVEGVPSERDLKPLRDGVTLKDGPTRPAQASVLETPDLWPRDPPIRYRARIPTHWIELCIREGRNRQVRRMTAAIGFPTLRLVRTRIGPYSLDDLGPGEWRRIELEPGETERPEKRPDSARKPQARMRPVRRRAGVR